MYSKILLKLSGEALNAPDYPFSMDVLMEICEQIKQLQDKGVKIGVVVGGGNICRGRHFETLGLIREDADYIGMEATLINAQMIAACINKLGGKAIVLSALPCHRVLDYSVEAANQYLNEGYVCVFGGGTGKPFCSTDTASALRAKEINAEVILMAKSGVDGVYSADPNVDSTAVRYDEMSFDDIISKKLGVIDLSAAEICRDHKIAAFVFNMKEPADNIIKAVEGTAIGTVIR